MLHFITPLWNLKVGLQLRITSAEELIGWLVVWLVVWLIYRLVGWLVGWLVGLFVSRITQKLLNVFPFNLMARVHPLNFLQHAVFIRQIR